MDAKEAINILAKMQNYDSKRNVEALEMAISALEKVPLLEAENARLREKEIPKEPIKKNLSHYEEGSLCIHFEHYCPVCKHLVESVYDYCGFCGQAIKNDKE